MHIENAALVTRAEVDTKREVVGKAVRGLVAVGVLSAVWLPATVHADPLEATYGHPGAFTYLVPNGVCTVTVTARGAAGGTAPPQDGGLSGAGGAGGRGGEVTATLAVAPGEQLQVNVGEQGQRDRGGLGGGGSGFAGGGGASDVRRGGTDVGHRVIVAGGGGGGSGGSFFTYVDPTLPSQLAYPVAGVAGGATGLPGANGTQVSLVVQWVGTTPDPPDPLVEPNTGGGAATADAAGAGGASGFMPSLSGGSGATARGGDAKSYAGAPASFTFVGGGGGGGYYGGGGGAYGGFRSYRWMSSNSAIEVDGAVGGSGGGGGSSYADRSATAVSFRAAVSTQDGSVVITATASAQACPAATPPTSTTTTTPTTSTAPTDIGAARSAAAVTARPALTG